MNLNRVMVVDGERRWVRTVGAVLDVTADRTMKCILFMVAERPVAVLVPGDREVNETKVERRFFPEPVRRAADDYLFVLVPAGRRFDWPKLRAHLGVTRMALPDKDEAQAVIRFEDGTKLRVHRRFHKDVAAADAAASRVRRWTKA